MAVILVRLLVLVHENITVQRNNRCAVEPPL